MRAWQLAMIVALGVILGVVVWRTATNQKQGAALASPTPTAKEMKLTSSAFNESEQIPERFTCHGQNINPPLTISGVPEGTKVLALVVDDPDAPMGTYTHWLIWNILPETAEIAEGSVPPQAQDGTNSAGKTGYTGPCPPARHRYFFKLYALDKTIGLDGEAKAADLESAMQGHIITRAQLIGAYGGK